MDEPKKKKKKLPGNKPFKMILAGGEQDEEFFILFPFSGRKMANPIMWIFY